MIEIKSQLMLEVNWWIKLIEEHWGRNLKDKESWFMITQSFDDKQIYLETTLVDELLLIGLSFWNCVLLKKKMIAWSLGINLFLEYCPLCYSEHDCINPNVVK